MDERVLAALDLGGNRFRAVVAEPDGKGGVAILGHASLPARGVHRGELTDLQKASAAIGEALAIAAEEAEAVVDGVAVSIGGDCVRSLSARGVVGLSTSGGTVRADHLVIAEQRVRSMGIPFDRVIVDCRPVEYVLDDRTGIQNPVGMVGARLELSAHLITASQGAVSAVVCALSSAGYRAEPLVFGPQAAARYLLNDDQRQQGCLLIDIGAECTQYALFYRGRMRQSGVVPVGGNHVTRDIVYGMGVELETAERWKRQFGVALRSAVLAQPVGTVALDESQRKTLAAICEARQFELLELVANGLQWGISRPALASGIILTGGGARLGGTAELAEQVFALRATTLRAPGDDYAEEPDSWATALGLAEHALDHGGGIESPTTRDGEGRLWTNMKRWIGRLV